MYTFITKKLIIICISVYALSGDDPAIEQWADYTKMHTYIRDDMSILLYRSL